MDLNKKRTILNIGVVAVVTLAAVAAIVQAMWLLVLTGVALVAVMLVWGALWRCPHCGYGLGQLRKGVLYCPHCGKKLE